MRRRIQMQTAVTNLDVFVPEQQRIEALRKQMAEQDKRRRFSDPDPITDPTQVVFVWYRNAWHIAGFVEGHPTPKRLARWRALLEIDDELLMRGTPLRVFERHGPPTNPPLSKRESRRVRQLEKDRVISLADIRVERQKRQRVDPSLSLCDFKRMGRECQHRAPWYVAYTNLQGRRVLKRRCTKHGWYNEYLPDGVKQIVRVAR